MLAHVCQDRFGFWFAVTEDDEGLRLYGHAGTREDMVEDALRAVDRVGRDPALVENLLVEDQRLPYPEGGLAPGYVPPEPRRAV
jgi:hypothetical protein